MSTFTHICVAGTNVPVRSGTFVPVCKKRSFIPDKTNIWRLIAYILVLNHRKDVEYC